MGGAAQRGGAKPGAAPGDDAAARAPGDAPAPPPGAMPEFAGSGRPKTSVVDLEQYGSAPDAAAYPQPQQPPDFNPDAELSGSGRPIWPMAGQGSEPPAEGTPVPTFDEMQTYLPTDENGDPDLTVFQETSEALTGKRYWNQLSDIEKDAVVRAIATGEVPDPNAAPQAAAQPVVQPVKATGPAAATPSAAAPIQPAQPVVQPDTQAATPAAKLSPEEELQTAAVEMFRASGVSDADLERAGASTLYRRDPEVERTLKDLPVKISVQIEEGDEVTLTDIEMPAGQALSEVDRRLKGVALLMRCVG
jgi:hypothetical protein